MSTLALNKHTPVDATAGPVSMTLPGGAASGSEVSVEKYDSTVNAVTVTGSIRGVSAQTRTLSLPREILAFRADSAGSWWPIGDHKTLTSLDGRFASQAQLAGVTPRSGTRPVGQDELVVSVADHGAVGDGVTDDTAAINAAIAAAPARSRVVLGQGKTHLVTNLQISNKSDLTFDGNGGRLLLTGNLAALGVRPGIQLVGTCSNITVAGHRIVGNGVIGDQHGSIFCGSGQTLSNIRVVHNSIYNVTLGISFSAIGGGTISGLLYAFNDVDTVVGTAGGWGYGLHFAANTPTTAGVAYAFNGVRMIGNRIRNASRHGIYHALGAGSIIAFNTIEAHRKDVGSTGSILPALIVARSTDVVVHGNSISDFFGGGIYVQGPTNDVAGPPTSAARNITIEGNTIVRPLEAIGGIIVGSQGPATSTDFPDGVSIFNNNYYSDLSTGAPFLQIFGGKRGMVAGNRCTIVNATNVVNAVRVAGTGESGASAQYSDDWTFTDTNIYNMAGNSGSMRVYGLQGTETTTIKMSFRTGSVTGASATFAVGVAVTNPNITVSGPVDGLTMSSGIAYLRADLPTVTSAAPAAPATTTSTTDVMAGLGVAFTPRRTGKVRVRVEGTCGTQTAVTTVFITGAYGTGTPPANGAASAGTAFAQGIVASRGVAAVTTTAVTGFAVADVLSGLTNGTTYWLDVRYRTGVSADAALLQNILVTIEEVA